jgi:peptidylprolyl isomerase
MAVITLTAALSGCSAGPSSIEAAYDSIPQTCDKYTTGANADKVSVTGDFGTKPTITFAAPLSTTVLETKVLSEGNGPKFVGAEMIKFEYTAYNAATGKEFAASKYDGSDSISQLFTTGQKLDFCHALSGVKAGSRVAILIPALMAHDGKGDSTNGISPTDNLLFVIDVQQVYLPHAVGEKQAQVSGMPTVVLAANGQPGVQIPKAEAPAAYKQVTLIQGHGDKVALGDTVTLHYSGFIWASGTQFDSSWDKGAPVQWQLTETGFIKGFVKALTGAVVGSQIMAVIPPSEGYGDQDQNAIPAGSTLVFVIDILGVDKAKTN